MENNTEKEEKKDVTLLLEEQIKSLENKDFSIYFFVMDTKGNATGAVYNIYNHVKFLRELGYNAKILHEKNDYLGVGSWLGTEYSNLPHVSIENKDLKVSAKDFLIIPELFANVMEQTISLPCKRIILSQAYDYVLEMLVPGKRWIDYGIKDCITTSEKQATFLKDLMGVNLTTHVVPVSIPSLFKPSQKPKKPIIAIYTRDQRDTVKIFKTFYIKYPHLKWFTFKDMRNMSMENFAEKLSECCVSVWIDDISGFGTFPLESIKCDVPVLGKVPNMVPEWMEDKNGMWTHDVNSIPDILAQYVQAWLEDSTPKEFYEKMSETSQKYTEEEQKNKINEVYVNIFNDRIEEFKSKLTTSQVEIK